LATQLVTTLRPLSSGATRRRSPPIAAHDERAGRSDPAKPYTRLHRSIMPSSVRAVQRRTRVLYRSPSAASSPLPHHP
jgi:hypothetical protein